MERWETELSEHPDTQFTRYLTEGIKKGFRLGYQHGSATCRPAAGNMASVRQHPGPVVEYVENELRANRVVEVPPEYHRGIQVSRFGVIPKPSQPGKWRLILDLSSPEGGSVNDGIDPALCSMSFATVDSAVSRILQLGRNALLAKVDVEHAYRNVPVHMDDRPLLGMRWQGKVYVDTVLPFGLRSAPKIFSSLADALEWILLQNGVSMSLHYLDDFLTAGAADTNECRENLARICEVCAWLGIPLKVEKIEGPAVILSFLGIELDTHLLEIRLPEDKADRLRQELQLWKRRTFCQKRALLSLIGKLSHACKVVAPDRIFLRRMIERAKTVRRLHQWIHLTAEFHSDLEWWAVFMDYWNGRSMMATHDRGRAADLTIYTDASGSWGCGASWGNEWIQCQWNHTWEGESIAVKELLPIVLAVAVWGNRWQHKSVLVKCDNMAVVQVVNKQNCRDPHLVHLMRCLHFFSALLDIGIRVEHIAGVDNVLADAISRNNLQVMGQCNRWMNPQPSRIPPSVWNLLVTERPDWRSSSWRALLRNSLGEAWHQAPEGLTERLRQGT